jgi:uncharacterized protein YkwD
MNVVGVVMDTLRCWTFVVFGIVLLGCSIPSETLDGGGLPPDLARLEQGVHRLVNRYRISKNLQPLTVDEIMAEQARIHSQQMARKRVPLGHRGFTKRVEAISQSLPLRAVAENVGFNEGYPDPATQAVEVWLGSAEHRKNMEGDFRLTGIGVARGSRGGYYFTQIFWQ